MLLLPLSATNAAILIAALDNYQAESEVILHGMSVSENSEDVSLLLGTVAAVQKTQELRDKILNLFA